jgi:hypothetical protein
MDSYCRHHSDDQIYAAADVLVEELIRRAGGN